MFVRAVVRRSIQLLETSRGRRLHGSLWLLEPRQEIGSGHRNDLVIDDECREFSGHDGMPEDIGTDIEEVRRFDNGVVIVLEQFFDTLHRSVDPVSGDLGHVSVSL